MDGDPVLGAESISTRLGPRVYRLQHLHWSFSAPAQSCEAAFSLLAPFLHVTNSMSPRQCGFSALFPWLFSSGVVVVL